MYRGLSTTNEQGFIYYFGIFYLKIGKFYTFIQLGKGPVMGPKISPGKSLTKTDRPSIVMSGAFPPCRFGHEHISTAILPLPMIQVEPLSVYGEKMCTKYR